jgi:hypothetical protein
MDSTTGGVLGIFGFLASVGGLIYTAINHKRIRCRCCGKDVDMSVDVDSTEPTVPPTVPDDAPGATAATVPSARSVPTSNRRASIIDTSPNINTNTNTNISESASASASANEVTKYEEYREDMYSKDLEPSRKKNKKSRVAPSD